MNSLNIKSPLCNKDTIENFGGLRMIGLWFANTDSLSVGIQHQKKTIRMQSCPVIGRIYREKDWRRSRRQTKIIRWVWCTKLYGVHKRHLLILYRHFIFPSLIYDWNLLKQLIDFFLYYLVSLIRLIIFSQNLSVFKF